MASFSIRPATPEDAPDIVRLINALAEYEKLLHESHPDAGLLAQQLDPHSRPSIEALVAHDDATGRCIGFALFFHNYSTFLTNFGIFLEDLFVEPDFRGQGVGFALFRRLAGIAQERGCKRLDWNVLDWNEQAISFYNRIGATALSDWQTMRLNEKAIAGLV
jgi:GNAT superfamily N-acetyltransferase